MIAQNDPPEVPKLHDPHNVLTLDDLLVLLRVTIADAQVLFARIEQLHREREARRG